MDDCFSNWFFFLKKLCLRIVIEAAVEIFFAHISMETLREIFDIFFCWIYQSLLFAKMLVCIWEEICMGSIFQVSIARSIYFFQFVIKKKFRSAWVAQLVKHLTLDFDSGHDLRVIGPQGNAFSVMDFFSCWHSQAICNITMGLICLRERFFWICHAFTTCARHDSVLPQSFSIWTSESLLLTGLCYRFIFS